ncbi:MAG: radical SAM protein [Cyanobacteriota/Melainabacteria group bacterium]
MFDREIRLVPAVPKSEIRLDVAFCYPGPYEIGMAGLGMQLVWWLFEQHEHVWVRRCFSDIDQHPATGQSDCYGFTLSWELDFPTVLTMLERYGIEPLSRDRGEDSPIVFGGGPVLSANPEPYASIFDVVLLGDAEATVPAFIEAAIETEGLERSERLKRFAAISGLYVPSCYKVEYQESGPVVSIEPIEGMGAPKYIARQAFKPSSDYIASTCILSPDTTWGATYLMEVVRSCPQECRFCLASYLTRPFRFASVDTIIDAALKAAAHTDKIGLLGPSITEHPEFEVIADRLAKVDNLRVNIASVRADTLTDSLAANIARLGQKSVTIALESGSQRLRDIMKKNLTEAQIENAIDAIAGGGLSGVKFYGIAGLPFEEQGDLDDTVALLSRLKKSHAGLKFVFGLSSFVPKAQTPFQRNGRDRGCKKKMEFLRKNLAPRGIDVRTESHNWSDIQALLSRGDRRLTEILTGIGEGAQSLGSWKRALKSRPDGVPSLDYFVFENYPEEQVLPWEHLVSPDKSGYLDSHLKNARALATE